MTKPTPSLTNRMVERFRRLFVVTLEEQHEDFAQAQQIAATQTEINFDEEMEAELPEGLRAKLAEFGRTRVAEMAYHSLQHTRRHNRARVWLVVAGLSLGYVASYGIVVAAPNVNHLNSITILVPAMLAGACFARALQPPLVVRRRSLKALNLFALASAALVGTVALISATEGRMVPAGICAVLAAVNLVATGVLWERWASTP